MEDIKLLDSQELLVTENNHVLWISLFDKDLSSEN